MLELPERLNYAEWDDVNFTLPEELILKENSFLHEAIYVFSLQVDMISLR